MIMIEPHIIGGYPSLESAFNWNEILLEAIKEHRLKADHRFYVVSFVSRLKANFDKILLTQLDNLAEEEAKSAPGFIVYYKGNVDHDRWCTSFCVWEDLFCARNALKGSAHKEAVSRTKEMYEWYTINRLYAQRIDDSVNFQRF